MKNKIKDFLNQYRQGTISTSFLPIFLHDIVYHRPIPYDNDFSILRKSFHQLAPVSHVENITRRMNHLPDQNQNQNETDEDLLLNHLAQLRLGAGGLRVRCVVVAATLGLAFDGRVFECRKLGWPVFRDIDADFRQNVGSIVIDITRPHPGRLFRYRHRSRAHRDQIYDSGDADDRRLSGQRK